MTKNSPLLPIARPILEMRARSLTRLLSLFIPPKSHVIDIGCGNMLIARELVKRRAIKVQGVDVLDMNLTTLPHRLIINGKIPTKSKSFDCVLLIGVLHHIDDQTHVLREAKRITKDKIVVFEDVYHTALGRKWLTTRDFIGNLPEEPSMHFSFNFHTANSWRNIFKKENMTILHEHTLWNPLRLSYHTLFILSV